MLTLKDYISFLVGFIIFILGFLPILNKMGVGPKWFALSLPVSLFSYIVAIAGLYLLVESLIEIANSNSVGWVTFIVGGIFCLLGFLKVLSQLGVGPSWFAFSWISPVIYQIIFIIEGLLLMIAMFAMEM